MFGLMPRDEIKIEKIFEVDGGAHVTLQSGENGWTVIWADSSTNYEDVKDTSENNFNKALNYLKSYFPEVRELKQYSELCEC